jgi:hypothetical protein
MENLHVLVGIGLGHRETSIHCNMTVWEEEKSVMIKIKAFFVCVICDANGALESKSKNS